MNGPPSHSGPRFITLNVVEGGSQKKYSCISCLLINIFELHLYCNYCHCILQLYTPFSSPHFREDFDNKFLICNTCVGSIAIDRDGQ